jgi:LacI family fructose operon transcriptional repressor
VLITASCLPENDTFYTDLADEGWSVVGMDRGLTPERFASVVSNDQKAAYALTRSVMDGSTRRIAWLDAMPELSVSRERRAGFFAALEGTGVEAVTFSGGRYERDVGVELAQQLFAAGEVDALVTASYALMEGVFDELLAQGGLPETLRLATFGDHRLLDFLPQPVNSALQDYDRIAELTLQCALGAMNGSYQCGQQVVARRLRTR